MERSTEGAGPDMPAFGHRPTHGRVLALDPHVPAEQQPAADTQSTGVTDIWGKGSQASQPRTDTTVEARAKLVSP
jgi:hypothetical protein